jgi:hypothetical protein
MATLAGNTIASTYPLLLKIDSSGIDGTLRAVQDGDATDSALSIATDSVLVKGDGVKLYFYDADGGEHISANTGGVLSIAGASEIDLTATAIDINGTVDMSSTVQVGGALTVGVDGTGYDVIFYGDTASSNMTWDESEDDLVLNDSRLLIDQDDNVDSIVVDTEATSAHGLTIAGDALTTGSASVFSTSSTALASTATGGLVEISSTGDTDTNVNNLLFIKNDHADSTGTTALKIQQDSTGLAIDVGGGYIANEQGRQDHLANTMPAPHYRFDGVNDYISVTANDFTKTQDISIFCLVKTSNTDSSAGYAGNAALNIVGDSRGSVQSGFGIHNGKIRVAHYESSWSTLDSTSSVNDDKWHHIGFVYDVSEDEVKFYIDGVLDRTGTLTMTDSGWAYDVIGKGYNSIDFFDGEISKLQISNYALTATEVKELHSGASVPFKYKGANGTELILAAGASDDNTFASDTTFWTNSGSTTINNSSDGQCVMGANGQYISRASFLTIGKRYRVNVNVVSGNIRVRQGSAYPVGNVGTGVQDIYFTATSTEFEIVANGAAATIDDLYIYQIGAVAEYDGSGITNDKWYDKSGNGLDGTVSGATDENTAGAPWISPNHPAFQVQLANMSNIAVAQTTMTFSSEIFDQDDNFNVSTFTFTAPVTGRYLLAINVRLDDLDSAADYYQLYLVTSNRTYYPGTIDPDIGDIDADFFPLGGTVLADMDKGDTAFTRILQTAGSVQTDVVDGYFSGYLVC